jgi:signal transduction histidine kinase
MGVQPLIEDLSVTVRKCLSHWAPLLERRGLEVRAGLPQSLSATFDPDAVEQILGNLLSNVEKYAADGGHVSIHLKCATGEAFLVVEDDGPGIPSGKYDLIFEPFERLRSDLREGVSGTGIGLTISRELARLQGGRFGGRQHSSIWSTLYSHSSVAGVRARG